MDSSTNFFTSLTISIPTNMNSPHLKFAHTEKYLSQLHKYALKVGYGSMHITRKS